MNLARIFVGVVSTLALGLATLARGQQGVPDLQGMWSDPPPTLQDSPCFFYCSDAKIERMFELLDDPANDSRPIAELGAEAGTYEIEQIIEPRLSARALQTYPLDPADDPGFLNCEPWGIARQVFAPHQVEITQSDDRVDMRYGEWEAHRTIFMDGRARPQNAPRSLVGFSTGHYEGDTLVIETTGIRSNITMWWAEHSDELQIVERYRRSDDGDRLLLEVTMHDSLGLTEPLVLNKVWRWAPSEDIISYDHCKPPTEFIRGTAQQL